MPRPLVRTEVGDVYKRTSRRLLVFSYDAVLGRPSASPDMASPSASVQAALKQLVDDPRNSVVIIRCVRNPCPRPG